ncbi:MAG TPA: hypothetical protein VH969_25050 [Actinophytocola sp.]|jgi:hypothetical protein|uniref:WapI family immunity protein n=1 Tax=Actinophytocola sp. TaxID=1872138 RepID=UPI002F957DEB
MRLGSDGEDLLELSIVGYQFPEAENPQQRYSWHMVQGRAQTADESWGFCWQALTCDESTRLVRWLGEIADATARGGTPPATGPCRASFTEPNLAFELASYQDGYALIRAELDLEFRSPANRPDHRAGRPNVLTLRASAEQISAAVADWEADVSRYPDRLADNS